MLDLTIVLLAYAGVRFYEQHKKAKAAQNQKENQLKKEEEQKKEITPQERLHYQQMSAVTIGTAVMRVLHPSPVFTLLNLSTYTYTMFPFYREVEKAVKQRLIEEGQVDSYLLMGIGNLLLLSLNRYVTAAMGVGLAYISDDIRAKARKTAQQHLSDNLFDHLFDPHQRVWIIKDGSELEVTLEQVQQGDVLLIKAGETIPVDGEVVAGMASVDQQAFTGESYPVEKGAGEPVFASTLMLTGQLQIRVEKSGRETIIGKLGEILTHTVQGKTDAQLRGEQWAQAANLPFLGLAGIGLAAFGPVGAAVILGGNTVQAIRFLAPLATINYQAVASERQILIKRGQCLEQVSSIDTFLFDKTGTLTDGELRVSGLYITHPDYQETDVLFYAALAEYQLTHPIAKAITRHATQAGLKLDNLDDISYRLGHGIVVQFRRHMIHVGSARFMTAENIPLSEAVMHQQADIYAQGHSLVMVAIDGAVVGLIELQATLRPEIKFVFSFLRRQGVKHIGVVSGDHVVPTQRLAEWLGTDSFFAEVLPEDKSRIVQEFQARGHTVCFVGDGINDALAMQQADLSISLRGATTLAKDVADIILMDPNLTRLCDLFDLSNQLEDNLRRGLNICYLGMGTVVAGTFLSHIDILTAWGIHFVLGSTAIGNSMLPIIEERKKPVQATEEKSGSDAAPPANPSGSFSTSPEEAKQLEYTILPQNSITVSSPTTVVIVGAGAAGIAGALSAAMQGAHVVLLEKSGQLGGTVTQALIHTLGGFFDDQGHFLNSGLSVELIERLNRASPLTCKRRIGKTWVLNVDPQIYAQVIHAWIAEYPNIKVNYHTTITNVSVNNGHVDQVLVLNGNEQPYSLHPDLLIDTTGRADVVRLVDPNLVKEGTTLAGFILQLRGVTTDAVRFPKGVALLQRIRKAVAHHELPVECATLWLDQGVYPDEVYIKFNLIPTVYEVAHMTVVAEHLLTFLRTQPNFSQAFISAYGQLGLRDGGYILGHYTLTEADLKQGRRFTDTVCRASWPIEYWHPDQGVTLDHFPPGHSYDIPQRSLQVDGLQNFFVAGKCFAAEPLAQASARVVGTCWAMSEGLVKAII